VQASGGPNTRSGARVPFREAPHFFCANMRFSPCQPVMHHVYIGHGNGETHREGTPQMTIQPWETNPAAVVYEFITAGGYNSPEQVDELLSHFDTDQNVKSFTDEAFDCWKMHITREQFADAMRDFIITRPDRAFAA
jgi:hypothetical protein